MSTVTRPPFDPLADGLDFLATLTAEQRQQLLGLAVVRNFTPGTVFIRKGEKDAHFFVLLEGEAEVFRTGRDGVSEHVLTTVRAPALVGDFALFDDHPRSASIRVSGPGRALQIELKDLRRPEHLGLYSAILSTSARHTVERLRGINDVTVGALEAKIQETQARLTLGVFFVYIITSLSIYTASLRSVEVIADWVPGGTRALSALILLMFGAVTLIAMKRTPLPLAAYGLNLTHWRRSLFEGVVYTLPVLALITLCKQLTIWLVPAFAKAQLFAPTQSYYRDGHFDPKFYALAMTVYILFVPLQELITRGGLQSSLTRFLGGSEMKVMMISILVSNLVFAMAHSHLRFSFVLAVFIPGLFFGWLYHRHATLLGATVSHVLVGVYTLFILGTSGMI